MTLHVDTKALDGIASSLGSAGQDLDGSGTTVPSGVDAGDATAAVLGILSRLVQDAGQMVVGLAAASDAVTDANAKYRTQDAEMADDLIKSWAE